MSGGFFRGTSADQDTRFSNKMKKLLKSQKFAPELDITIDTSKVQMDVIKPWVATRVTELLGFEDEVLINFIYGMLEEKNVDGKHVQIQLTGFMEKNTGKFMKELWSLLISAQSNVSGIPQQFLDQKAEETRLKKVESERIAAELQRKRDLDKVAEDERQREKDAAAEAAKKVREANGSADNDRVSKHADDIRSGRGNGHFRRSISKGRSSPGRNIRRRPRSRHSSDSSLSRYSRSVSRSPRRRRRSFSPDRPSRVSRVVRSPVRRSYSRSPIRRRKSSPVRRSPVRRRYVSRSPPARRSPSYSLSPASRGRARSPRRRNGGDVRREFRSPDRMDRPGVRERRSSRSPGFRGPEPHQLPPVASRRPTGFGDKAISQDADDWRAESDRAGVGSTADKRLSGDKDEKNVGTVEAREIAGEKKSSIIVEERKTGSDRGVREKKDKWSHGDLIEEEGEPRRGGRDVVEEKKPFTDFDERRSGNHRSDKNARGRWAHNDPNDGQREVYRARAGVSGEKRPHSEIERNTGVDRSGRDSREEDRNNDDNGRSVQDRFRKDGGNGKRDMDLRREDRYFTDQRGRPSMRERSPPSNRQQGRNETRGARKVVETLQSPAKERRSEDNKRRSVEFDDHDSDDVRENVSKKSKLQEVEDDGFTRENDEDSLSPRGSEERRKEEKRRKKEEKRLRREERHKRKREEKQKRKDKKSLMKTGGFNGEDRRDSLEGTEKNDEKYDQKQREDELRHAALESLRAKKAISH